MSSHEIDKLLEWLRSVEDQAYLWRMKLIDQRSELARKRQQLAAETAGQDNTPVVPPDINKRTAGSET